MKRWVTEIRAIDPTDPDRGVITFAGPNVPGKTLKEAEEYCQNNKLGYCKVVGMLICEIPWSMGDVATLMHKPWSDN